MSPAVDPNVPPVFGDNDAGPEGAYTLIFLNDLEPGRACIRWKTLITE